MNGHVTVQRRGVSLIEALVAMAVMGFGMLAVLGMQSTLRHNGDQARQRTEALRLAQDAVEQWRAFSVLDTTANRIAYEDIASDIGEETIAGANATYRRLRVVNTEDAVAGTDMPRRKLLVVTVSWTDRNEQPQVVRLNSVINGAAPELGAGIALTADATGSRRPRGRNRAIPPQAKNFGDGTSGYIPPGQTSSTRVAWQFNNVTAVITLCTTTQTSNSALTSAQLTCDPAQQAQLVAGFVRYATIATQPTASDMADPLESPPATGFSVSINRTAPTSGTTPCFIDSLSLFSEYFCAVPVDSSDPGSPNYRKWSGSIEFGSPLPLASSLADFASGNFKVCRYHAAASYANVNTPLTNQNFAFIRSGNGVSAFTCPSTGAPQVWAHQPAT
jgi:Tfp pilus assembly protein PilV